MAESQVLLCGRHDGQPLPCPVCTEAYLASMFHNIRRSRQALIEGEFDLRQSKGNKDVMEEIYRTMRRAVRSELGSGD